MWKVLFREKPFFGVFTKTDIRVFDTTNSMFRLKIGMAGEVVGGRNAEGSR